MRDSKECRVDLVGKMLGISRSNMRRGILLCHVYEKGKERKLESSSQNILMSE